MTRRDRSLPWLGALGVALLPAVAAAQTLTLVPPVNSLMLNPGETKQITATICVPGQLKKADVYVLIDTTPSMVPVIDEVRNNAAQIVNSLLATPGVDLKVGLGTYRDFPFDAKPFDPKIGPTSDAAALVDIINGLSCAGGGDGSECQFYALQQIATDNTIGFRPDAKRIVVWFGDSPGHDPICPIFVGFGEIKPAITETTATAALQGAGPGGTSVIAISTPTGYDLGLNDDPQLFAGDYAPFCTPGGMPGQADRVAQATHGISTFIDDPVQITQTILDTVSSLLTAVDLRCQLTGALAPFLKVVNPPSYLGVVLPDSPSQSVCKQFDLLLEAPPCPRVGKLFPGSVAVTRNNLPLNANFLTVLEPACNPLHGLLLAGVQGLTKPKHLKSKDPTDTLYMVPLATWKTVLEDVPAISIPNVPSLEGFRVYLQGLARYPKAFGADQTKVSNGLIVTLGASGGWQAIGAEGGLKLWMDGSKALLGGSMQLHCAIDN